MTIQRLEQYAALRLEVADLEKRERRMLDRTQKRVADTVKASSKAFPYTEHTVTVKGYSEKGACSLSRIVRIRRQQRAKLSAELAEIETWIATVPDSRTRQLIRYRFIDGHSWASAAKSVYGHPCESTARSRVERYLKNKS